MMYGTYRIFGEDMTLLIDSIFQKSEWEKAVAILSSLIQTIESDYKYLVDKKKLGISKAEYMAIGLLEHGLKVGGTEDANI